MLFRILRPTFWQLDRRFRATPRWLISLVLMAVLLIGQWLYSRALQPYFSGLNANEVPLVIGATLLGSLFLMLLISLLDMARFLQELYFSAELELLLVAPISRPTVFAVKLFRCSRAAWMVGVPVGLVLLILGIVREADALYFVSIPLILLAGVILVTSITMTLVMLVSSLVGSTFLQASIVFVFLGSGLLLVLLQQPVTQWLTEKWVFWSTAPTPPLLSTSLALIAGVAGLLGTLCAVCGYAVFRLTFYQGLAHHSERPLAPSRATGTGVASHPRRSLGTGIVAWLPMPVRLIALKEWWVLFRDVRGLLSLLQPLALVLIPLASLVMVRDQGTIANLRSVFFWFELLFLGVILSLAYNGLPRFVLLEEGRNIALLRSTPVNMAVILRGKYWASLLPTLITWTAALLLVGLFFGFAAWQIGIFIMIVLWALPIVTAVALAIGGMTADFSPVRPAGQFTLTGEVASFVVCIVFALGAIVSVVWLIEVALPTSDVMLTLQASGLTGTLTATPTVPIIALGLQLMVVVSTPLLWRRAVRTLNTWEEASQ